MKIIICKECKGFGYVYWLDHTRTRTKDCQDCKGSGRLVKRITYEAYEESSIKQSYIHSV